MGHAQDKLFRHEQVSPSHAHNHNRQFDMAETAEIPSPAPRRTETSKTSAFGDWDLRRETIVRPTDSVVSPVERFEAPSLEEDELETPPFSKIVK